MYRTCPSYACNVIVYKLFVTYGCLFMSQILHKIIKVDQYMCPKSVAYNIYAL